MWQIGIIGGSGLDNPVLLENRREKEVDTPFGKVSLPLFIETCASFLFGPLSQAANRQSLAFRHLFPNSARFGYTTEGSVFISTQMSTNAVSTLWKAWVLFYKQDCENYVTLKHACKHEAHLPRVKKKRREFCLDWDNFGFIYAGVSSAGSYESNAGMCCENWCLFCLMKISILVLLLCVIIMFQNTGNKSAQKSWFFLFVNCMLFMFCSCGPE